MPDRQSQIARITLAGEMCIIEVYRKSVDLWAAHGSYGNVLIDAEGNSPSTALVRWREMAKKR